MSSKGFLPTIEQKKICLQCMQPRLNPWVKQVSWRREWPTAGFLPENFHAQRSLMGYSSQGQKTFEVPVHYCSLLCWTLLSPPDTSTAEHRFCFGPAAFLSGSISNCPSLFPSSILDTFQPGGAYLPTWCHIFLPFHTAYGALEARILEWFSIPSSSGNGIVKIPSIQYCPKIFLEKKKR